MERQAGTTVLTGRVIDQAHLVGLIQRTQELGLELVSVGSADEGAHNPRTPSPEGNDTPRPRRERQEGPGENDRDLRDGSQERS